MIMMIMRVVDLLSFAVAAYYYYYDGDGFESIDRGRGEYTGQSNGVV
jgi:hypothetical protein